ncbi:MAG: hypothetical protein ABSB50_11265 [Terracidiphilus sp.]|jgi:hypothetical protein
MQLRLRSGWAVAAAALVCLGVVGCGTKVQGHTYAGNGNVVSVEFQSGGKAYASMGPMTSACTYTQSGKTVNLVCEGDTTVLTLQDDGSLNGPPEGMLAHMTKVK